jgi:hypothetical protein
MLLTLDFLCDLLYTACFIISESFSEFIVSSSELAPANIPFSARANSLTVIPPRKVLIVAFDYLLLTPSQPWEKLASTPTPCGVLEDMWRATLERSADFEYVSSS